MSYTPTEWKTGDTITAEKLNKLEQGVADSGGGGGALIVNSTYDDGAYTLDKTWKEIRDVFVTGVTVLVMSVSETSEEASTVIRIASDTYDPQESTFGLETDGGQGMFYNWRADSANGYPYYRTD